MKNKVYILGDILTETQTRYPHIDLHKFDVLYHGCRRMGIKKGRNAQFYTTAWKRGWLAQKDADDLRKYIGLL